MPLPRFHQLPAVVQSRLLERAAAELEGRGLAGASLNRILAEAGLSKGAFYYYFEDKADLFSTVVARAAEELAGAIGRPASALSAGAFWTEAERFFGRLAARLAGDPGMARLARIAREGSGGAPAAPQEAVAEGTRRWLERELERGRRLGAVREDLPVSFLASLVLGLCLEADRWRLGQPDPVTPHELRALAGATFETLRRLCEAPARGPDTA